MLNNQTPSTPVLIEDLGMQYPNETSKQKRRYGLFKCHCGKEFKANYYAVIKMNVGCGCFKIKHGQTNSNLYGVWEGIVQRTLNHNDKSYYKYGGRGITICNEWRNNFIAFYNWAMENGYQEGLTIDRIDNDGNYEPSNCRWADYFVQSANTRIIKSTNTSGYRGVSKHHKVDKWVAQIQINNKNKYLGYYDTKMEAAIIYDNYILENNLPHTRNFNTMT